MKKKIKKLDVAIDGNIKKIHDVDKEINRNQKALRRKKRKCQKY